VQGKHATLKIGCAATPQVIIDYSQVHIIHRLEISVLHGMKKNAVFLANALTIVSIHQQVAPQHQRVAAALSQQATF